MGMRTDGRLDVGLEDLVLGELLVEVRREPDLAQRPLLRQDELAVEHGGGALTLVFQQSAFTGASGQLPPDDSIRFLG